MTYTPRQESLSGSDFSGSDEDENRTYTLTNDNAIVAQMRVIKSSSILQYGVGFTFNTSTNVITIVNKLWDSEEITIDYFTCISSSAGNYYTNTLGIVRASGLGVEVYSENLGTGNNSTSSFDIDKGNIIDNSYTLKYAASGSNDLTDLTETTHYVIQLDSGLIELTAAGITALGTNILYIDYIYSPKHSNSLLYSYLPMAGAEVDKMTDNYWETEKTSHQYFDGYESGYPQTDEPFGTQIEPYAEFILKYKNAQTITSVLFLDKAGDTDRTLDSDEYRLITNDDTQESRILIDTTIPNGKANVKVTFTHGYATVPVQIQQLTAYVAGMMAMVNISGGSYKDASTYSIDSVNISIGQVYVNVREAVDKMKFRIDMILEQMGGNFGCA